MSYFGVSTRNGVGLGLGTVPSLTNTPLGYRLAPSLDLSFAGSDTLSPLITFSRTTSATVTGSNGLIQNAPMNLLTFSEQFDNAAWIKTGSTVSANTTAAPNGTTTADTLIEDTSTGEHRLRVTSIAKPASAVLAYSMYAKASGSFLILEMEFGGNGIATIFDLTNGLLSNFFPSSGWTIGTTSITPVGNGWYRCVISGTTDTSASVNVRATLSNSWTPASKNPSYTGNGTSGVFLWGAQLELGSTATTYNPTTVKNLLGFTENFDNAAWTKSNAFVQTNLLTYSEDFSQTAWGKANITLTPNATASPTGAVTAQRLAATTTAATSVTQDQVVNATSATFTVYAKQDSGATDMNTFIVRNVTTSTNLLNITVNYSTGAVTYITGSSGALMQDDGNGWWRIQLAVSSGITSGNTLRPYVGASGASVPAGQSAFFWGAQLVQGTTPGDYKATYAAAAAVGYTDIYGQPFAQKLVENSATNGHLVIQQTLATVGTTVTASVYCKVAERSFACFLINDLSTGAFQTFFDLTTGATNVITGGSWSNIVASTTAMGNGWYRCSVTAKLAAASTNVSLQVCPALNNSIYFYTGDGTSGIYIFGAQLSDSASVDPYVYQPVAAPTSTAYYGPRFDYDPVTLAPKGLLIEEQRTNLVLRSEEFDNAAWIAVAVAGVGANTAVAPSGSTTADTVIPNTANATHYVYQTINLTSGTSYTMTVYAKPAGYNRFMIRESTTAGYFAAFDVASGTVVNTSGATGTISAVGNGWYRCSMTMTAPATVATVMSIIGMNNTGTTYADATFIGNGTSGLFLWGAQLEAGAFATSYIPTVASQVTRAADNASMIGNNFARWYNVNAGSLFTQFQLLSGNVTSSNTNIAAFEGAGGLNMTLHRDGGSQAWRYRTNLANLNVTGVSDTASNKTVFAYATSDYPFVVAGGTVQLNTGVGAPPVTTSFVIGGGSNYALARQINGTIARIAYYNRRLSNTELRGITS